MKNSIVYGILLILVGILLLFSGWASFIAIYFFALLLLADSSFWIFYWMRSREKITQTSDSAVLLVNNGLKCLLAISLVALPAVSVIGLIGFLLFVSSIYQFLRIKDSLAFFSPVAMKVSIIFNSIIALASIVFIINPRFIMDLFNFLLSFSLIIPGIFLLVSKKTKIN